MVLDSDDDEPAVGGVSSLADFEGEEEESDSSEPYHKIIRHIDVRFGTCARHIAIPHIPAHIEGSPPDAFPRILLSSIVVVAACNDNSIRLLTLPLLPPLPFVDETSYYAIQRVIFAGVNTHSEVPSSIALTHSVISDASGGLRESSKSRSRSRSRLTEGENISEIAPQPGKAWCFLLVSISATAGGLLLTHQIPLISDTQLSTSGEHLHPVQRCYLRSSCSSSKVVFNPSAFPANRHSTALISSGDAGCVKLYHVFPDRRSNQSRGRRNSTATNDSATSGQRTSPANSGPIGRFLITLFPGFIRSSGPSPLQRRKRILDVAWVASGRAIIVLLEDGEWGVWDVEGAGPGSGTANLLPEQSSASGIQGGALTKFALSGWVALAPEAMAKVQTTELRDTKDRELAPMTPHTRKVRGEGLFKGKGPALPQAKHNTQPLKGHICITEHTASKVPLFSTNDESFVMVHGSNIIYVASLQALWRAEASSKGTFDPVESVRPSSISNPIPDQERMIDVAELKRSPSAISKLPFGGKSRAAPDLLVVADYRLIFLVSPLTQPTPADSIETKVPLRFGKAQQQALGKLPNQALLGQGQLDLEGMDRILEGMTHGNGAATGRGGLFGKSVTFDVDGGEDMSMTSPTPKTAGKYRHTSGRSISRSNGDAFS